MNYNIKIDEEYAYLIINDKEIVKISIKEFLTKDSLFNSVYPTSDYLDEDFLEDFCCDVPSLIINDLDLKLLKSLEFNDLTSEDIEEDVINTFNDALKEYLGLDDDYMPLLVEEELTIKPKFVYLMLNKPSGYVTSTKDPDHRTIMELIKEKNVDDLFPVGRLDFDSTGLLLITNDGKLSNKMLSPKSHVEKTYEITSLKELSNGDIHTLEQGILMDDSFTQPCHIKKINSNKYHIIIKEGRFHQVKRMLEYVNNKVLTLNRIKFGPLELDYNLKPGSYRFLTNEEIEKIRNIK